jgi:hypothetical protein
MAIGHFIPQIWSAQIQVALHKALVFAQEGVVNRDYEGEISQAGDTVRINSISRPTIGTYVPNVTSITPENLTSAQRQLVIDQAKYFAFEVDDVEARQAQGNVMPVAMDEAAYGLADLVDQYIAAMYTSVPAGNQVAAGAAVAVAAGTPTDAYDKIIVPLSIELDEANVPSEGRWLVAPPWLHGRLLLDGRFVKANESNSDALRNGQVGDAAGFKILKSNNVVNVTGDDYAIMAGGPKAISYAEQINKVEAYRPESAFSDAVKGLHLWGAKVVRPEMLAYALASQT